MGLQKNKNEQIFVGYFCGKHSMGAKKTEISHFSFEVCVFFVATFGNDVISVGVHKKNTDLRTVYVFRSTVPASEDEMCPRWSK